MAERQMFPVHTKRTLRMPSSWIITARFHEDSREKPPAPASASTLCPARD
jgi:hypothetical protein